MEQGLVTKNNLVFIPVEDLLSSIDNIISKRIMEKRADDLQAKLLSPKEARKLFNPQISLVTLDSWAEKGYIRKHYIGGRVYYKYSELMEAVERIKPYSRNNQAA